SSPGAWLRSWPRSCATVRRKTPSPCRGTTDYARFMSTERTAWRSRQGPIGVLTGAGISTDSGIPDFRGPKGVWTKDPIAELLFTYPNSTADPELRQKSWRARRDNPAWQAEPNAAHKALAELEHGGRAVRIITQNIDRLHQRAGSTPRKVIEIHGNMF